MARRQVRRPRPVEEKPLPELDPEVRAALVAEARALLEAEALPAIEDFRPYMLDHNSKLEVAPFLDHIDGPQIMIQIGRPDGHHRHPDRGNHQRPDRAGLGRPQLSRFKTGWVEKVPGGAAGVTREAVLQRLKDLHTTDFS
ncbi:MAG: hypothetical protein R2853_11070 [Thermomicrobiales bacterium]